MVREISLVAPPGVLTVNPGNIIRVTSKWAYIGPAVSGKIYTAMWVFAPLDPHNEIAHGEKYFTIPDSPPPGQHVEGYVDITVPSGFAGFFGLYTKVIGVPGPDIFSPYYENVIEIVGAIPEFTGLVITSYVKK